MGAPLSFGRRGRSMEGLCLGIQRQRRVLCRNGRRGRINDGICSSWTTLRGHLFVRVSYRDIWKILVDQQRCPGLTLDGHHGLRGLSDGCNSAFQTRKEACSCCRCRCHRRRCLLNRKSYTLVILLVGTIRGRSFERLGRKSRRFEQNWVHARNSNATHLIGEKGGSLRCPSFWP